MTRIRQRLSGGVLTLAIGAIVVTVLLALVVAGPDLPGPRFRELLGLTDTVELVPCNPDPDRVLSPARPFPPDSDTWRREPSAPEARVEFKATTVGRLIYLTNGQGPEGRSQSTVLVYDPERRRYRSAPDTPIALDHTAAVRYGGDLYLIGGAQEGQPSARFLRYSPKTRRWEELSPMPRASTGLAAAVIDDRLYAVGGGPRLFPDEHVEPYTSLQIYDFETSRWTVGPDMPTARHHLAAAALGGRLYVLGGRDPDDFSLSAFERFVPGRNRWEALPPLPLGVGDLAAVSTGSAVIAIGGDEEEGWMDGHGWVTPAVWSFDPGRGVWRRLPDLRTPRHGHGAAVAGGRIYVFGGSPCPGYQRISTGESLPIPEASDR